MKKSFSLIFALSISTLLFSQAKPEDTEFYSPVPPVVTPGTNYGDPPSDAIILFDGKKS